MSWFKYRRRRAVGPDSNRNPHKIKSFTNDSWQVSALQLSFCYHSIVIHSSSIKVYILVPILHQSLVLGHIIFGNNPSGYITLSALSSMPLESKSMQLIQTSSNLQCRWAYDPSVWSSPFTAVINQCAYQTKIGTAPEVAVEEMTRILRVRESLKHHPLLPRKPSN